MRRISFILLCLLFSSAVSAQEATVPGYLHDGPHEVLSPWMVDSLDVNGKKFETAKMLDGYGSGSVEGTPVQTAAAGELKLAAFPDGYAVGRLTFYINSDLIEFIEETPDTVVTMASGRKLVVREKIDTIVDEIVAFRRRIGNSLHPRPRLGGLA